MKKLVLLLIVIILIVLGINYVYKDHRNIAKEEAEFKLSASKISKDFIETPNEAQNTYLNKTIEVIGNISEFDSNSITLDNKVLRLFTPPINKSLTQDNSQLTIKGRLIGYDDLLELIKLDHCKIIK